MSTKKKIRSLILEHNENAASSRTLIHSLCATMSSMSREDRNNNVYAPILEMANSDDHLTSLLGNIAVVGMDTLALHRSAMDIAAVVGSPIRDNSMEVDITPFLGDDDE